MKRLVFAILVVVLLISSIAASVSIPLANPQIAAAEEPESGVIVLDQNTEVEYTGNSSIDETTGQLVYEYRANISSLPLYMPDLETRIDPRFYWDSENGEWYSGVNIFEVVINGSQVIAYKDGEEFQWDPIVYIGGQVIEAPDKAMLISVDPLNENYQNNILEWDYGTCVRQLRLIEGIITENYVFYEDPGADVRIDSNLYKTPNFVWIKAPYAYDADYRPLEVTVDENGKTVNASEFANAIYPVVVDDSVDIPSENYDGTIVGSEYSYSTAWSGTTGIIVDESPILWIGQSKFSDGKQPVSHDVYEVTRTFLTFDTRSIPLEAEISSSVIRLCGQYDGSNTDFNIVIQSGMPTYPHRPLLDTDYDKNLYSGNGGQFWTGGFQVDQWNYISTDPGWIKKEGYTKLCLRSSRDINGNTPSGDEAVLVWSREQGIGCAPELLIDFTVPCNYPTKPSSPGPSNSASGISVDADLSWYSDADSYEVYFGTSSNPSYYGYTYNNYYSLPRLSEYTTYYWRILAYNDCGRGTWGPLWEFTTGGAPCTNPGAFSLSSPARYATGVSIYPCLDWSDSSDVNYYNLYLGTSSNPPLYDSYIYGSEYYPSLSYDTRYYWKVEAVNDCGSRTSATWYFNTESAPACPSPGTPVSPNPSDRATGIPISTALDWSDCTNADYYYVYFGTSQNPSYAGYSYSSYYNNLPALAYGTTYYWRIVAVNDCGTITSSESSSIWRFTTGSAPPTPTPEIISTPNIPEGLSVGEHGRLMQYTSGGSTSNLGNPIQYRFSWGDGTFSGWSSSTSATHSWSGTGKQSYQVTVQAKSSTGVLSAVSEPFTLTVNTHAINLGIVPIDFSDKQIRPTHTKEFFEDSIGEMLEQYYSEVSYDSLSIDVQVYTKPDGTWFRIDEPITNYIGDLDGFCQKAIDITEEYDEVIDFHIYGSAYQLYNKVENGRGVIAFVTEESLLKDDGSINVGNVFSSADGIYSTGDGVNTDALWVSDRVLTPSGNPSLKVMQHEFAHYLGRVLVVVPRGLIPKDWLCGLPDLDWHMGLHPEWRDWVLMTSDYSDRLTCDHVHMCSYEKEWLGWLTYADVFKGDEVTVKALPNIGYGNSVYRYTYRTGWTDWAPHHFILEWRSDSSDISTWDTQVDIYHDDSRNKALAIYEVDERNAVRSQDTINLQADRILSTTLLSGCMYSDPIAQVAFRLTSISDQQATVSVEDYTVYSMTGASLMPSANVMSAVVNESTYASGGTVSLPDTDLHAYSVDGVHVGLNSLTGEYEINIPGAIASGDLCNGREWILVPDNLTVRFSISTKDTAEFLEENPEALTYTDGVESYNISTHYFNSNGNKSDALWIDNEIPAGAFVDYAGIVTEDSSGNYNINTVQLTAPVTSIGGPYIGNEGAPITFDGSGSYDNDSTIISYEWNFGDGSMAVTGTVTPTHIYLDNGTYNVTLTVSDDYGLTNTSETTVDISNVAPIVNARTDIAGVLIGSTISFSGSFTDPGVLDTHTIVWNFGDGTPAVTGTLTPTHAFTAGGSYTVTLTVADNDGGVGTDTLTVHVNHPPVADAGGPYTGNEGSVITFNGSTSYDPDGIITVYSWNFGDSTPAVAGNATQTHEYGDNGTYAVTLTVTDNNGAVSTAATTAAIANVAPIVNAGPDMEDVPIGSIINFNGSFTDPGWLDTHTIAWDFGDGTPTVTGTLTPSHAYTSGGDYTVTLTVIDDDGGIGTDTATINVNVPPVSNPGGPYTGNEGSPITFNGSASYDPDGIIVSFEWDLDNDSEYDDASGSIALFTWYDDYSGIVRLRVTDDTGEATIAETTVTVHNVAPAVDAGANVDYALSGSPVDFSGGFTDPGTGDTHTIEWNFGDGTPIVTGTLTPTHTYASGGNYTVTLTVTDDDGGVGSDTLTVHVNDAPIAVPGGPYTGDEGSAITFNGSASCDPDGSIVSYEWDLNGDGDFSDAQGAVVQHTWPDDYTGDVSLKVTDDEGATGIATTIVTVNNVAPEVEAGPDQSAECCVTDVSFNGSFTDPGIPDTHTVNWDFGDGATTSGTLSPAHTYCDPGVYTVTLTVTDDDDGIGTDTMAVAVTDTISPEVSISSPEDGRIYINTQGLIPVSYTTSDICDPAPDIAITLDGVAIDEGSIDPSVLDLGGHTLTITVTDSSGNFATASATFVIKPQFTAWGRTWGFLEWYTCGHPTTPTDFFGSYSYPLVTADDSIYSWISADDSSYWRHTGYQSLPVPWEQSQLFVFKITQDRSIISNLSITWTGHGGNGDLIYHTRLKIWNYQTGSWCTLVDVTSPGSKTFQTYDRGITTNAADFIEAGTGNVSILVTSDDDGRGLTEDTEGIFTDYIALNANAAHTPSSALTTTYTFSSGGGTNKWCWEGHVHMIDWNSGHPVSPADFANSYGYAAGGSSTYSALASSDDSRWKSDISHDLGCCAFDRNCELFKFNIAEGPSSITNIGLKWEGHGTTGETIYYTTLKIWNPSTSAWEQLHNQQNTTSDVTWIDNIAGDCSDYIDASGNLYVLACSQRSGLSGNCGIWTDYIEVTITNE